MTTETVTGPKVTMVVFSAPVFSKTGFVPKLTGKAGEAGVFDVTARVTLPAKPLGARLPPGRLPRVIVTVPVVPELIARVAPGASTMLMVVVWVRGNVTVPRTPRA